MQRNLFVPADILLPKKCDMTLWSTVACDQFSSNPSYWDHVAELTRDVPSTMHMILPEAYLETVDQDDATRRINQTMADYISSDLFEVLPHSYIYVKRTLPDGTLRRGLVGAIDLNYYNYSADSITPIRATEHTVESRLPARVEIRKNALLEMPHIMLFVDDRDDIVMRSAKMSAGKPIYDFDLMCSSGHISGYSISGTNADTLTAILDELSDSTLLEDKYGFSQGAIVYAIGDGNHSLAAAKKCWEEIRVDLTEEEQSTHPARFALVELMNIHDSGVSFHPIHRAVFGIDSQQFVLEAEQKLFSETGTPVTLVTGTYSDTRYVQADSIGMVIEAVNTFCESFAEKENGQIDYIHGDEDATAFGRQEGNVAILLPSMKKEELFTSVMDTGVFCKKSFSIGEAPEKRFYLECRKICR